MTHHSPDLDDDALITVERAILRLTENRARQSLAADLERAFGESVAPGRCAVVDALTLIATGATIRDVGDRLGIDQSRASRVVALAVAAGDVVRIPFPGDARRAGLKLTDQGKRLHRAAQTARRTAFAARMASWTAAERRTFAELLARFAETETAAQRPGT